MQRRKTYVRRWRNIVNKKYTFGRYLHTSGTLIVFSTLPTLSKTSSSPKQANNEQWFLAPNAWPGLHINVRITGRGKVSWRQFHLHAGSITRLTLDRYLNYFNADLVCLWNKNTVPKWGYCLLSKVFALKDSNDATITLHDLKIIRGHGTFHNVP